jgi:hypothetical protein
VRHAGIFPARAADASCARTRDFAPGRDRLTRPAGSTRNGWSGDYILGTANKESPHSNPLPAAAGYRGGGVKQTIPDRMRAEGLPVLTAR